MKPNKENPTEQCQYRINFPIQELENRRKFWRSILIAKVFVMTMGLILATES